MTIDGTVSESAFLVDRISGQPREVDVVIVGNIGEHEVVVGIECRDSRRKATVEWVEQMLMKHHTLPTSKLILVSTCGFTSSAAAKAESGGAEAYSFDQAVERDWNALLGEEGLDLWTWRIRGCGLVLTAANDIEHPGSAGIRMFMHTGVLLGNLEEVINAFLKRDEVFKNAAQYARDLCQAVIGVDVRPRPSLLAEDSTGSRHEVEMLRVYLEIHDASSALTATRYRDLPVAFTQGHSPAGNYELTLVQTPSGPAGAISVTSPATGRVHTAELRFTTGDGSSVFFSDRIPAS